MVRVTLSSLDWVVLALFALGCFAAVYSARQRSSSILDFLTAGRSLSLPAFVATLVSTWYGGILGVAESVSYYGVGTWLAIGVPYYVFGVIYGLVIAPKVQSGEQISIPARFEARFGKAPALAAAILIFLLAVPAAHMLMLSVLAQSLTGLSLHLTMLLIPLVITAILFRSGFLADVRLGFVAFVLMYVGFFSAFANEASKKPLSAAISALPPEQQSVTGGLSWISIASYFVLGLWTMVDPGFYQRVVSTKSAQVAKKGVLASVLCWMVFDFFSITCAIYAVRSATAMQNVEPLYLYPALAEQSISRGLRGLFVVGILGTVLSACCGYALVAAGTLGNEILPRLGVKTPPEKSSRWGILVACLIAIPIALAAGSSVVNLWYGWAGAVVGALLIPFLLSYFSQQKLHPQALAVGVLIPFAASIGWMVYAIRSGNPYMNVKWGGQEFSLGTLAPALILSVIFTGISRIIGKERS